MRWRTRANTITMVLTGQQQELLGPNPLRKAFIVSPVCGSTPGTTTMAMVFGAGTTNWVVPENTTYSPDMYAWGSGGNGDAGNATLGGGGGGGGGFAAKGPSALTPGTTWGVSVDAGNGQAHTGITDPTTAEVLAAGSGSAATGPLAGGGGAGENGAVLANGGAGLGGNATSSGGGGGAAGYGSGGTTPTTLAGGAGGGNATLLGYGVGGDGGNGANPAGDGGNGTIPGGGGGGAANGGTGGAGADGMAVIFWDVANLNASAISISPRQNVAPGQGILNYLTGQTYPTIVDDCDIGTAICEPWWIVSGTAGIVVQVTEYSYDPGSVDPAY